jgi:hypothetical protein
VKLKLNADQRTHGTYIHGYHGVGKSSLLTHLIMQDICAGRGVAVIDCTADLMPPIIARLPEHRLKDTIYFSTKRKYIRPIEFLKPRDEDEEEILMDDMVKIFDIGDAKVGEPMLYKMLATLLEANKSGANFSLLDLDLFVKNPGKIIGRCSEETQESWRPLPKAKDFETPIHRLLKFQARASLHTLFQRSKDAIDIPNIVQTGKILLADLKDTPTDFFLASLIVSKIRQGVWRNADIEIESKRPYFYLYVDEAHEILKFAADDFETIMTRARKYKLCLTMTNQLPDDLPAPIKKKLVMMWMTVAFQEKGRAYCFTLKNTYELKTKKPKPLNRARYAQILRLLTVDKSAGNDTEPMVKSKEDVRDTDDNAKDPDLLRKRPQEEDS